MHSNQWENQNKKSGFISFARWGGPPLHIDLYGARSRPVSISSLGRWTGNIRSGPHYTPLFRSLWIQSTKSILLTSAPVHTWHFLQFFSPTSKTSISGSKMGRSEWQSPITATYLKPRVNLFSGFECVHYNCMFKEDLQIAKKFNLSPRNVQKLFFFPPVFLILCLSLGLSGWHIFFFSLEQITTPTEVETLYCNL